MPNNKNIADWKFTVQFWESGSEYKVFTGTAEKLVGVINDYKSMSNVGGIYFENFIDADAGNGTGKPRFILRGDR